MRIREFRVYGLFGVFDHRIPLNDNDRITVLYGPNGFGKTTVLRLLNRLAGGDYLGLLEVPFARLELLLEADRMLVVEQSSQGDQASGGLAASLWMGQKQLEKPHRLVQQQAWGNLLLTHKTPNVVGTHTTPTSRLDWEKRHLRNLLAHMPARREEDASAEHLLTYYVESLRGLNSETAEPEWLSIVRKQLPAIRLVDTERLNVIRREDPDKGGAVDDHASYLAALIKRELARYAERSQSLDRSFPARLLEALGRRTRTPNSDPETLARNLEVLESKRATLRDLGLLEETGASSVTAKSFERVGSSIETVLSIYIDDNKEKLSVLEPILQKVALLTEIVNGRFLFKSLKIDKEKGFVVSKAGGGTLPLRKLSSGEQHELVLLSELLFHVEPNSLILIDEPEISLNVAWQVNFLRDLGRIQELIPLDVVVASHSPQIVHDRWDLTVELKGPNSDHAEEARH